MNNARPQFSIGWCIFWAFMFMPAIIIQVIIHYNKVNTWELTQAMKANK